jgi:anti-anti-sigma factor
VSIDGVTVVSPRGRVDSQSAGHLGDILRSAMSNMPPLLVVDMSGVNYIGSKGLQALLSALSECRHAGGDLKLAGVSPNVMHVLNIIQFDRLFSICRCVDSALAELQAERG